MKADNLAKGDKVKVTKGVWKGSEGTVDDIQVECSVIRIKNKEGENVYALAETVEKTG
jgi:transcription antitermination factor NusG